LRFCSAWTSRVGWHAEKRQDKIPRDPKRLWRNLKPSSVARMLCFRPRGERASRRSARQSAVPT
jgi:hypothetical protein